MDRIKTVNGIDIPLTAEEEIARDAEEKELAVGASAREMASIRNHRNGLLSATDWTGTSDLTMSDAMKTYRQMLRDIPASNTVYADVDWGTKP
jgi:hypothetical protein